MGKVALYYTLDVISDLAFGERFGNLDKNEDCIQYLNTMTVAKPAIVMTEVFPWLVKLGTWRIFQPLVPNEKDEIGIGRILGFVALIIRLDFKF